MAHVSRKLSNALEGALAGGGDPATSPLYVFTPFLKLIVIGAVAGVADVTFGATVWLVVFTIAMVSTMYRLVMRWVTDGSGGSGLAEEEFGGWAVKVNAAITFIEYTLTFLVSMAALVTFIADRLPVLNESALGIQYRGLVAVALSVFTGWLVNRGPKVAARAFGPATAGVLLLLWAMVLSTLWKHLTGDPALAGGGVLPAVDLRAFSLDPTAPGAPSYLGFTLGGFSRILAVMTGIEVFANLVAAYEGDGEQKAAKAFGSLQIVMGTTAATMLVVGPAIFAMSDPGNAEVSVFTQTMDQLLPFRGAQLFGTAVAVAVLLSASAASSQGLQNLALGLTTRNYIPYALGRPNVYGVADKPVWIEVGICCACFLAFGTSEETYLAIYAAGVFILLSMTGWAAAKRLARSTPAAFDLSAVVTMLGAVVAAVLTSVATVIIFGERFFEGAWTFLLFIPILYAAFTYYRRQLGAPSAAVERLGEIEEAALAGFGPGQFEPLPRVARLIAVDPSAVTWPAAPDPGEGWRGEVAHLDHLLVPLDGTPSGARSLPLAKALMHSNGGRLSLLTVVPGGSDGHRAPGVPRQLPTGINVDGYLRQVTDELRKGGIAAEGLVRSGPVAATIITITGELNVDGIVMGARVGSTSGEDWLGQVSGPVIRNAQRPVIIVPSGCRPATGVRALDRVLVALDGSEFAERVLPYARGLAAKNSTELVLLTVPEVPAAWRYGPLADLVQELRTGAEDKAQSYLESAVRSLREEGLPARGVVAGSAPARTILAVTSREGAELTMIATRGRGGLARLLMGSIAERVLKHASCPVFLLPIREHDPAGSTPEAEPPHVAAAEATDPGGR